METAAATGVDFACVITPFYYGATLTDRAIVQHFLRVADSSPIPLVIYNAPRFTGLNLGNEVILELRNHPRIVGVKDSTTENLKNYPAWSKDGFAVLAGTASALYQAVELGAVGGVLSLANAFPEICCSFLDAWSKGHSDTAKLLHKALAEANAKISGRFGVAGTKWAMDRMGYVGGRPRLPVLPLSEEHAREVESAVRDLLNLANPSGDGT